MRVAANCKRIVDAPVFLHYTYIDLFRAGPLQLIISENFRELEGLKKFYRAKKKIAKWDITRISPAFARMWIETPKGSFLPNGEELPGGVVLPLVLKWEEAGKIARHLGVNLADLTKYILGVKDNNLFLTGRMKDNNDLTNEQIRQMIADYLGRRTDKKPPTLFADIFMDYLKRPSVMLGRAPDGNEMILPVKHLKLFEDFSMAGITFLSRKKVEVAFYVRRLDGLIYRDRYIQELDIARPETPAPQPAAPLKEIIALPKDVVDLRGEHPPIVSKKVKLWMHEANPSTRLLCKRNIIDGRITLCMLDGLYYPLPGGGKIPHHMPEGVLLLQLEEYNRQKIKTASLFHTDSHPINEPEKKLVVWRLPIGEPYRGVVIFPELKKTA